MYRYPRTPWIRIAGAATLLLTLLALTEAPPLARGITHPKPARTPKSADNSYCMACHAGLKNEKLAARHQQAGIGCSTCHGTSKQHSSDEDGITPPDIIYSKASVAPACRKCHEPATLQQDTAHEWVLAGRSAPPFVTCTDCHGRHRMPVRTRRWDKSTRKLIKDDGVRMVNPAK
jgi:hypothetical protein